MGPTAALMLVFLTVLLLSQQLSPCESLRVAAFNIQKLGEGRISDNNYTVQLAKFICKQEWDIAFLQELTSKVVLTTLIQRLNRDKACTTNGIAYSKAVSSELPKSAMRGREIHAYIFQKSKVKIIDAVAHRAHYPVANTRAPVFFRPPAVVHVQAKVTELKCMPHFVLIGIHTRPTHTYSELNGLVDVYERARIIFKTDDALILGDLNADGSSFGPVDKKQNVLWNRGDFKWLVKDAVKTNVDGTKSYDRIIAAGHMMRKVAQNAQVPHWAKEVELLANRKLSDHWPVSTELWCPDEDNDMKMNDLDKNKNKA